MDILVVDDHAVVRSALCQLLTSALGAKCWEAESGEVALAFLGKMHVDVALLDLGLPGIGGLAILSYLRQMGARTLVLSMNSDLISVRRALQSGAAGYISKNAEPGELITAIHAVAEGRQYIERRLAQDLALQPTDVRWGFPKLTAREREIMQLLAFGKSFYEIGVMLGVSYKTIANTAARLRSKLGAARTSDLIRLAIDTQNDR